MKRKAKQYVLIFGAVVIALFMVSSATAVNVLKTNELTKNSLEGELQPNSNLQFEQELYNYMVTTKIGEVKQSIYKSYKEEPMEDDDHILDGVDAFFEILPEIGVTEDMTILEADSIIEENWDIIEASVEEAGLFINRYCRVDIDWTFNSGCPSGWAKPIYRPLLLPALRCRWHVDRGSGIPSSHCSVTIDGIDGLQKSEDKEQNGIFLIFFGSIRPFLDTAVAGWTWKSISDLPFENGGNNNQQSNPSSNPQSSSSPNLDSSATAVTVTQTSETKNIPADEISETYVDPDIYLTTADLSILYKSLQYIDNPDVLQLVQGIIDVMEDKGYVTAEDIQDIENDLGIFLPVHIGFINSNGVGTVNKFPGGLLLQGSFFSFGIPAVLVHWQGLKNCHGTATTKINGGLFPYQNYEGNHDGYIIGYVGLCNWWFGTSCMWKGYSIMGMGTLIIVIPGDGCNMQSNPQSQPYSEESSSSSQQTTTTFASSSSPEFNTNPSDIDADYDIDVNTMTIKGLNDFVYEELEREGVSDFDPILQDVDETFQLFADIGITSDMTIAEAEQIIENTDDELLGGMNILFNCKVRISGSALSCSGCWPLFRLFRAAYVRWHVHCDKYGYVDIVENNGLHHYRGSGSYSGRLICFRGCIICPLRALGGMSIDGGIEGGYGRALICISNVPSSGGSSSSTQSEPLSTPSSQPNQQSTPSSQTQEQSSPSGTEGSSSPSNQQLTTVTSMPSSSPTSS